MQNSFEQPDLELMLRGRPVDLPPIRVQLVGPAAPKRRLPWPDRFAAMLKRDRWILAACMLLGAVGALAPGWLYPPLYEARATLEVMPPADAETIAKRAASRQLLEGPALKLQIDSLPEYTRGNTAQDRLRRLIGLSGIAAKPSEEDFVRGLRQRLQLALNPTGRLIHMQFQASDPPRAAAYLDLLAGAILSDQEALRADNTRLAREAYAAQMARARAELQASEEDLTGYARSAGLLLDDQAAASMNSRFLEVQKNIASARAALPAESVAASEAAGLTETLEKTRQRLASMRTEQGIRLESKKREFESKRAIYDAVYKKVKEAETEAAHSGAVRLLAPAQVTDAARPLLSGNALLGAFAGLAAGILFSLGRGVLDGRLHDAAEIEGLSGVALLGVIPRATLGVVPGRAARGIIDLNPSPDNHRGPELFRPEPRAAVQTASALGEAFRHILAGIWIAGQNGRRPRVLLFASPAAGEGKTTLAANIGIALAHTRRRVLIIDANLRHPQLHSIFSVPSNWGLANLLAESEPVEDYPFEHLVFKTDVAGLYVLPAGTGELEISNMRHIDRLTELLLRFRLEFHAVLIDTPGALAYPDARVAARLADSAVLVLRAGVSSRQQAEVLARQLETDGSSVLGAVMNDCPSIS